MYRTYRRIIRNRLNRYFAYQCACVLTAIFMPRGLISYGTEVAVEIDGIGIAVPAISIPAHFLLIAI